VAHYAVVSALKAIVAAVCIFLAVGILLAISEWTAHDHDDDRWAVQVPMPGPIVRDAGGGEGGTGLN
jgi:hypothetical protein